MYTDFSSMPPDEERQFLVFEQRTREAEKSAWRIGGIVAAVYGLLMVVIVLSHEKPPPLMGAEDITVSEERRSVVPSEIADDTAPEATPTPSPTPSPTEGATPSPAEGGAAPAEGEAAPAEGGEGGEGGEPTAPAPQPGATKASPTELIKANQ